MRSFGTPLALLALAAALSACGSGYEPKSKGEAYFVGYGCVKCHQVGELGHGWGPDLTMIGVRKSPEWLDLWLKDPHAWRKQTIMPNFHLPDATRAEMVAFLSEQKGQAWEKAGRPWTHASVAGDPIKQGEVLFNRAGCVACHGQNGIGGYPNNNVVGGAIPGLTKVYEGYSKEELHSRIKLGKLSDPENPSEPAPLIRMPEWGQVLSDAEIDSLVAYLMSFEPKGAKKSASDW